MSRPPAFFVSALRTGALELARDEAEHAIRSLRLSAGDVIRVFDGRGGVGIGTLSGALQGKPRKAAAVRVDVTEVREIPPVRPQVVIVSAACKGERLDWMIEKCAELGVAEIILTRFEHSVVKPGDARVERLGRIAVEACKQSGNAWLPSIRAADDASTVIRQLADSQVALAFAHPAATSLPLHGWLQFLAPAERVAIAFGPEGGFGPNDLSMLRDAKASAISLGPNVLRIETAVVATSAAILLDRGGTSAAPTAT